MIADKIKQFKKNTTPEAIPSDFKSSMMEYVVHVEDDASRKNTEYRCKSSVECNLLTFHAWGILAIVEKNAPIIDNTSVRFIS